MGVFKPKKLEVRQNEIRRADPVPHQVGQTVVELTFDDKKKFRTLVVGQVYQYIDAGQDEHQAGYVLKLQEPRVGEVHVTPSIEVAKNLIRNLNSAEATFLDNQEDPREARVGHVVSAKILGSHGHIVKWAEAYIAKKEAK